MNGRIFLLFFALFLLERWMVKKDREKTYKNEKSILKIGYVIFTFLTLTH